MEGIGAAPAVPEQSGGLSVVLAEGVWQTARRLGIEAGWERLWLGNQTQRKTAYRPAQRIAVVLAGLACGLRGIGPGNLWLRPNSALQQALDGRFPDQGTVHRWLQQTRPEQAAALRRHLHEVARTHGRFRRELWSGRKLIVDLDGQGLAARGRRFEKAAVGYFADDFDRGYQRYVCYAGATREVLDELLLPGNQTLMSAFPQLLDGLNELFSRAERDQVVLRADSHGGTVTNLQAAQAAGYHYLFKLMQPKTIDRLRKAVAEQAGTSCCPAHAPEAGCVTWWELPAWELINKDGPERRVTTRVILFHDLVLRYE